MHWTYRASTSLAVSFEDIIKGLLIWCYVPLKVYRRYIDCALPLGSHAPVPRYYLFYDNRVMPWLKLSEPTRQLGQRLDRFWANVSTHWAIGLDLVNRLLTDWPMAWPVGPTRSILTTHSARKKNCWPWPTRHVLTYILKFFMFKNTMRPANF